MSVMPAGRQPLAGLVLHRVTVQHGEELLGRRQLVDRHRHDVVVVVVLLVLVEVITDPRTVGEELFDPASLGGVPYSMGAGTPARGGETSLLSRPGKRVVHSLRSHLNPPDNHASGFALWG